MSLVNDRQIRYMTQDEVKRFFSKIHHKRDRALFDLVYKYGLRVSEATLLTLRDVDLERGRIYIRRLKNGISGEKPMFRDTKRLLKAYLEVRQDNGSTLFTGRQGGLSDKRIQQLFKHYARKARLDPAYSVHSLRHSIATHLLEWGEGVEYVRDHLGHKNIANTMIYAQITDRRRQETFERLERSGVMLRMD